MSSAGRLAMLSALALVLWACGDDDTPRGTGGPQPTGPATTSGGGGTGGDGASLATLCENSCLIQADLLCPAFDDTTCRAQCEAAPEIMPWCAAEGEAWARCLGAQPLSNFACNPEPDEQPVITMGCGPELSALLDCWYDGPEGGLPDLTPECEAMCAAQTSLSCYADTCVADCLAAVSPAIDCHGTVAGQVHCLALLGAPDYICNVSGPELADDDRCDFYDEIALACANR